MENQNNQLLEILQQEKFLAFFDFRKIDDAGNSELDGICKVAMPQNNESLNYICLTFIFDVPTESARVCAIQTMHKLSAAAFKQAEPSVYAMTSVPAIMRNSESYIHQVDIVYNGKMDQDYKNIINKLVFTIRNTAGLDTEVPQLWEDDAPAPTEVEKENWSARIKAFLGLNK